MALWAMVCFVCYLVFLMAFAFIKILLTFVVLSHFDKDKKQQTKTSTESVHVTSFLRTNIYPTSRLFYINLITTRKL